MSNAAAAPNKKAPGKAPIAGNGPGPTPDERRAALQFLRDLATEVSEGSVNLPCFPNVFIQIRKALADPKSRISETVKIVGAEPRLAARLLQAANSAIFNPSGKPLTDLRAAITRLGQRLVQSVSMAFAVQQMRQEASLRSIAKPLSELWKESIAVASICQVVARRTKVNTDEAFLTGLLHGIGRLYIMVRAVGAPGKLCDDESFMEMIAGWHAAIGKAVLENWGFAEEMSDAVGAQGDFDRQSKRAELTDVLITGVVLAEALQKPKPRTFEIDSIYAFRTIGLSVNDCAAILKHTEYQLGSLHESLGY
jgi:HD-like signal output (HDOD) protein